MAIFCNLMYYNNYVGKFDGLNMTIKKIKISLILALSLGLLPLGAGIVSANDLTMLDIKRNMSSDSSVDVTFYTTLPYSDSVAVTKKSPNKYVILMPNVSGSTGKTPDLSGVKDMISNVDVKSVNDGAGSYTKVTLTTTKPITIKTRNKKSLPVTEGQKAYRELLAQSATRTPVVLPEPKQEIPVVNKQENQVKTPPKQEATTQTVSKKSEPKAEKKNHLLADAKKTLKKASIKKETKVVEKTVKSVPAATTAPVTKQVDTPSQNQPVQKPATETKPAETIVQSAVVQANPTTEKINSNENGRIPSNMPITLAMIFIPLAGLLCLFKLIRASMQKSTLLKRAFIENLKNKKDPVKNYDNIINADMNWQEKYQKFVEVSNKNYEKSPKKLASDSLMQGGIPVAAAFAAKPEKAASYVSEEPEKEAVNIMPMPKIKAKKFKPAPKKTKVEISEAVKEMERQINKLESENVKEVPEIELIEEPTVEISKTKYAETLEKSYHKSPAIEKTDLDDDVIIKELETSFNRVQSEDKVIASRISEAVKPERTPKIKKLKAFANNPILQETQRNRSLPNTPEEVKRAAYQEGKHVHLGYSKLHSNPRLLEGANLSAADLIAKSSRFLPDTSTVSIPKPVASKSSTPKSTVPSSSTGNSKGYMMATIDEFFALSDEQSKVTASEELSNKVARSLANIKPSMKTPYENSKKMTNPISQLKTETQENYLNGLIVKSGFNIDKDRGFYLVNLDGEMSLIGRIKEEVFVLKKFDRPIEKPLQVRKDNPNVYMVKTDGFKSLVEVSENNMGVLIEL